MNYQCGSEFARIEVVLFFIKIMFAMKKILLTAAFVVALSGFAAAQSTSAKPATKQEKATVKKGSATNTESKNTVLKQEASANAKAESAVKLVLIPPTPVDTTAALPKVKDKDF
jgi:ABC-type glycerol-3-phosphate transport system substrate-binding protein